MTIAQTYRLDMVDVLSQAQSNVDVELHRIGCSLSYASEQLSVVGLEGEQARVILNALAANSSFTIESATQNLTRIMMTVEPAEHRASEGKTIGVQKWLNINLAGAILPSMTSVLPLIVGFDSVSMAVPVFDLNRNLVGTVRLALNHVDLLNTTLAPILKDTGYAVTLSQTDSKIIYGSDSAQIGKALNDSLYADYPELLSFAHRVAEKTQDTVPTCLH